MNENRFNTLILPNFGKTADNFNLIRQPAASSHKLFIRHDNYTECFSLTGRQLFGRAQTDDPNDICIMNPFISRQRGFFETIWAQTFYTATKTTNGIYLNGLYIAPGDRILLNDGDELSVPNPHIQNSSQKITLTCAFSDDKINFWNSVVESQFDSLTALPNRKLFTDWFNTEFSYYEKSNFCFFLLDIDKFKNINDEFGHAAGDDALKALADVLRKTIPNIKHACRWGGDEFVGVLKGDSSSAADTLKQMGSRLAAVSINGQFHIHLSIGLCEISETIANSTLEHLLSLADNALYQAKETGRGKIVIYKK